MVQEEHNNANNDWGTPHAFHLNLPPNHFDQDGVPYITKFAHKKARIIVDLAMSIKLTEDMFVQEVESMDIDDNVEIEEEAEDSKETLVRTTWKGILTQLSSKIVWHDGVGVSVLTNPLGCVPFAIN